MEARVLSTDRAVDSTTIHKSCFERLTPARLRMVELGCSMQLFCFGSKPEKPEESFECSFGCRQKRNDKWAGCGVRPVRRASPVDIELGRARGVQLIRARHAAVPYE